MIKDGHVFIECPGDAGDVWVEVIEPALAALLGAATAEDFCDAWPVVRAATLNVADNLLVFFGSEGPFVKFWIKALLPARGDLGSGAVRHLGGNQSPLLAVQVNQTPELLVFLRSPASAHLTDFVIGD
jgi:hypothetical protein